MIQSLERAVAILKVVSESPAGARLRDLAAGCGLKRNTAYNLAETLVAQGLLARDGDGAYVIGELTRRLAGARPGRLVEAERALAALHSRHPASSIYYSELGQEDVVVRFYFTPGRPGEAVHPDCMTLNPYITVGGLLFLAFSPAERLGGLRLRNPFEHRGQQAWGDRKRLEACLAETRRRGYSEGPGGDPAEKLKVGLPCFDASGQLSGAVTFDIPLGQGSDPGGALDDAKAVVASL